jgi:inositol polyphosphate 5-phosphatase INPP5B/F
VAVRINYQPNPASFSQSSLPITFTFVNSHLAAFDDHLDHRSADFHDISRRLEFGPCIEYMWAPRTRHGEAEPQTVNIYASDVLIWLVSHPNNQRLSPRTSLYVYMTGRYVTVGMSPWSFCANVLPVKDLNYRLNLPDEDVRHLLSSNPTTQGIHALLQFDEVRLFDNCDRCPFQITFPLQLKSSIHRSKAFRGFDEHPISFLPLSAFV